LVLKLREVLALLPVINQILSNNIPILVQYRFLRLQKILKEEQVIIDEQRKTIVRAVGTEKYLQEDGVNVLIPENTPEFEDFKNQYLEFLETEVTLEKFVPIHVYDIGKVHLTGDQLQLMIDLNLLETPPDGSN
jgi:hypothetical protein